MRLLRVGRYLGITLAVSALSISAVAAPAAAVPAKDPATKLATKLVKKTNVADANRHLIALQRIADRNGGTRASNTPGYDASVDYVATKLKDAGYQVTTPEFTYEEEVADANFVEVGSTRYTLDKLTGTAETPVGGVTGPLRVVPEDNTTGCEAPDFAGADYTGGIAVIRRGGCNFSVKATNAMGAGAIAVIITNNVPGPLTTGTLGGDMPIVVGAVSQEDGNTLATKGGQAATVDLRYSMVTRTSRNVIAQTTTGRKNNVVMAGAHLDSVPAGPGINDNGTGSAGLLDIALKLGSAPKVSNAVRFAWWGSEELGLLGSEAYVASLTFEQQLDIALYLNFDMIGSPNAAYFVYDGDDSDGEGSGSGPYGSAQIEKTFTDFLNNTAGIPTEGTDFDGRSDYGPFIAAGIPSGGLFTGAEGEKTAEQVAKWGGTAGVAYDPCYHQACDNLGNVNRGVFDKNIDAAAWTVGIYAYSTEEVNGVPPRTKRAAMRSAAKKSSLRVAPFFQQKAA